MFLLVSVRHVGAHPDELEHGVSIQSSINLSKTLPWISRIRIIPSTQILARVLCFYLLSFPRFWTLSVEWFWFLFSSILNGVTHWKPAIRKRDKQTATSRRCNLTNIFTRISWVKKMQVIITKINNNEIYVT